MLIAATRVTEAGIEARVLSGDAVIRQDLEAALEDIAMHARVGHAPWAYLAVQIDDFGGIDGCIRPLLRFRHFCPEVPVLLLSARAVADDLSQERLALCDITLKTPLDFKGWDKALSVARENNAAWRVRLRARAKEARRLRAERCRMSAGTRLYSTRFM